MPISVPLARSRSQVAWLDEDPPADAKRAFEDRQFLVTRCTKFQLADATYIAGLSLVVLSQRTEEPHAIASAIRTHARRLMNHDCQIILLPASSRPDGQRSIVLDALAETAIPRWRDGSVPPRPYARVHYPPVPWHHIANMAIESPAGPAPASALVITPTDTVASLNEEQILLLRRGFSDCAALHLVPMDESGRSGGRVFRAFAELAGGAHGRWPQAFFVKLGRRRKILQEYTNYLDHVGPYIPFHLGPRLAHERCCLGATAGLLVGDYVEDSESLRSCASQGRADAAIACLFDRTLLGWYRSLTSVPTSMATGLGPRFPTVIDERRFALARGLGAELDLAELRNLFMRCDSVPVLAGPTHGDLHAANVRVRGGDAVLIDFYAYPDSPMPVIFDAATLEASLLVDCCADDVRPVREWLEAWAPLYGQSVLQDTPQYPDPKDDSYRLQGCIRQIRRFARQWEGGEHQYAAVLSLALLLKAAKDRDAPEPEASRRAAAYVFAERVLRAAFGDHTGQALHGTRGQ